jgi:hypothetical protein
LSTALAEENEGPISQQQVLNALKKVYKNSFRALLELVELCDLLHWKEASKSHPIERILEFRRAAATQRLNSQYAQVFALLDPEAQGVVRVLEIACELLRFKDTTEIGLDFNGYDFEALSNDYSEVDEAYFRTLMQKVVI